MIPVQASERNGLRFRVFAFSLTSSVNSQTKTSKVRDDKLGGGDHSSAAEKKAVSDIIGLEEREHVPLLE
jgi:hypothetical protein